MTAELFLGIDAGTSGVRACAINRMEEVAGIAMTAMPLPMQDGARVEQEADIWWDAVAETIRSLGGSVDLSAVRRIAIDGTSGTLLLAAADGRRK